MTEEDPTREKGARIRALNMLQSALTSAKDIEKDMMVQTDALKHIREELVRKWEEYMTTPTEYYHPEPETNQPATYAQTTDKYAPLHQNYSETINSLDDTIMQKQEESLKEMILTMYEDIIKKMEDTSRRTQNLNPTWEMRMQWEKESKEAVEFMSRTNKVSKTLETHNDRQSQAQSCLREEKNRKFQEIHNHIKNYLNQMATQEQTHTSDHGSLQTHNPHRYHHDSRYRNVISKSPDWQNSIFYPTIPDIIVKFRDEAPLRKYLLAKTNKEVFHLKEIFTILRAIIVQEELYDESNPVIIICNKQLEIAIGMRALHTTEVRAAVIRQIDTASNPSQFIQQVPTPGETSVSKTPCNLYHLHSAIYTGSPCGHVPPFTYIPNITDSRKFNNPNNKFSLKEKFKDVIDSVLKKGITQTTFKYEEITTLLSKYILENKATILDERNIKVALVDRDLLGIAFKIKAFHRTQVTTLIREQLTLVEDAVTPEEMRSTNSEPMGNHNLLNWHTHIPRNTQDIQIRQTPTTELSFTSRIQSHETSPEGLRETPDYYTGETMSTTDNSGNEEDSSTENEQRRPIMAGGEDNSDTDADRITITTDVIRINKRTIFISNLSKIDEYLGNSEYLGDGEEEKESQNPSVTSGLGRKRKLHCIQCFTPNTALIRYCIECWQDRKNWIPERPKRPKKKGMNMSLQVHPTRKNKIDSHSGGNVGKNNSVQTGKTSLEQRGEENQVRPSSTENEPSKQVPKDLCIICEHNPKDTSFIHGKIGHQACCYKCAKETWNRTARCPICRRMIEKIVKNIMM